MAASSLAMKKPRSAHNSLTPTRPVGATMVTNIGPAELAKPRVEEPADVPIDPFAFVDLEKLKPREREEGASRNYKDTFTALRAEKKNKRDMEYMIVVKRLAQLTIEHLAKPPEPGLLSWIGLGATEKQVTVKGVEERFQPAPASSAKSCFQCGQPFGWLQKKMLCQLCLVYCCANCVKPRVPLQVIAEKVASNGEGRPSAPAETPMIETCARCQRIVRKWKYQLAFQRCRLNSGQHPLSVAYENMLQRDSNVVDALVMYEKAVAEVDTTMKSRRALKRGQEAENALAMRLAEAVQQAKMVDKQRHIMNTMIDEINSFLPPPQPRIQHAGRGRGRDRDRETSPPLESSITAAQRRAREIRAEAGDPIRIKTKSDPRTLVYNISYAAENRIQEHNDFFQELQKRVIRAQLVVAGEVYNKMHQLEIELKEMDAAERGAEAAISGGKTKPATVASKDKKDPGSREYLPSVYLFVSEILTVMKAEIHELMIAMGKQHWIKFEKRLDAALREQMKDSRLLGVQLSGSTVGMDKTQAITKVLGVLQYEIKMLENNTAPTTLKESKQVIGRLIQTLLSHYF